ncbi:IclR family transcriptional regulator [Stenotrophomonas maltophilia]|uniref:IclR family transcriptional regulator n=1 Tax=Stenotrophomonas maltophilia TaxID=40324 RepID=UPI0039C2BA60
MTDLDERLSRHPASDDLEESQLRDLRLICLDTKHLLQAGVGGVRPGWGLRHLAEWAGPDVLREIRPQLYRLFEATRETVDVSTLWEGEVLFLDRFLSNQYSNAIAATGPRFPAYAMANGKALLASLEDAQVRDLYGSGALEQLTKGTLASVRQLCAQLDAIRRGGFAYDIEEHEAGRCAIGLPLQMEGAVAMAISVVVPAQRFESQRKHIETALKKCVSGCRR